MVNTELSIYHSPVGTLHIATHDARIIAVSFSVLRPEQLPLLSVRSGTDLCDGTLADLSVQLDTYFSGNDPYFNIPLRVFGTDFELRVWTACMNIPFGETRSYGELARDIGNARAARAVGSALSLNRIPLFIPCHRVVRANGETGEYAGGIKIKEKLLQIEKEQ